MTTAAVLFVCLGNICRSPMAEGAFRAASAKAALDIVIDSAGTASWHTGKAPDRRAVATAHRHGIDISGLRARQITRGDFDRFTHIYALDGNNLGHIHHIAPSAHRAHIGLLLDLLDDLTGEDVADPYYGGEDGFERVWIDVARAADALVALLRQAANCPVSGSTE